MAMAIISILAKMASTSIHENRTGILMLRAFATSSASKIRQQNPQTPKRRVSRSPAGYYFRHRFDYSGYTKKMKQPKFFDYYMDLGGLEPARFAMEEFNMLKNVQLQFVRVVKAHRHMLCTGITSLYVITLEAVDAGVAKHYEAKVSVNFTDGMFLEWFCLVVDDGCLVALYDHLENFFALKDHEDQAENHIPMCKQQGLNFSNNSCIKLCRIQPAYDLLKGGKMQKLGRWAVRLFNDEKNANLRFLRVVRGSKLWLVNDFYLTLEAADAGVLKVYQALLLAVDNNIIRHPNSRLNLFGQVDDNRRLSVLIDKRHEACTKEPDSYDERIRELQQGNCWTYCHYKDVGKHIPMFMEY